jgi:hypothetical protein
MVFVVGIDPPLTLTTVTAEVPEVVASPERSVFVTEVPPEKAAKLPEDGVPVTVTVPLLVPHAPAVVVSKPPVDA